MVIANVQAEVTAEVKAKGKVKAKFSFSQGDMLRILKSWKVACDPPGSLPKSFTTQ